MLVLDYLNIHQQAAQSLAEGELPVPDAFKQAHPDWRDQFTRIFVGATTAIFLEETAGKEEADAYIMMEQKSSNFDVLPSAVTVFRRYLAEREEGKYNQLADYLPVFLDSLRITHKLRKM